jgi:hypothetical protein
LEGLVWVFWAGEEVVYIGCKAEIVRKETVFCTEILEDLNVQQHHCEKI